MIYCAFMGMAVFLHILLRTMQKKGLSFQRQSNANDAIIGAALFLIAALRKSTVGHDTLTYIDHFHRVARTNWRDILRHGDEPGFYVFAKLITPFTDNPQWLLAAVGLFYAAAICAFIRQNSCDPSISFVMLIAMQFFAFSITGLRQTLAMSTLLLAFGPVKNKKPLKYAACVLIAWLFHRSAVFAIPVYFAYHIKINDLKRLLFLFSLPVIYWLRRPMAAFLMRWIYPDYTLYASEVGTIATFALYVCIWLLYVLFASKGARQAAPSGFESLLMIGVIVQMFVSYEPNIFRVALYYQISGLVVVPQIVHSQTIGRARPLPYLGCMAILLLLYFGFTYNAAGANPYAFFWQ